MKRIILASLLGSSLILAGVVTGCNGKVTKPLEDPDQATMEWEEVSQAVADLFAEFDPPLNRNLEADSRVNWENCASRPEEATQNMTGTISITGKQPLLAFYTGKDGTQSPSVSDFLGRDQTEWWYWIDKLGSVHLVIMK